MDLRLILVIIISFSSISYANNLVTITKDDFLSAKNSTETSKIINYLTSQFDSYLEEGVSQEQLNKLWNDDEVRNRYYMTRFQIINQKLYADSYSITYPYFTQLLQYLQKLVSKYKINNIDFITYVHDEILPSNGLEEKTLGTPAFIMSKDLNNPYEREKFLFPDIIMLRHDWKNLIPKVNETNITHSWESKKEKIFWRGWPSGSGNNKGSEHLKLDKMPRISLVMLSALYPDFIDAKFTIPNESPFRSISKDFINLIDLIFTDNSKIFSIEDHLNYKYLISVDGSTCAWKRVPWIMLSNSVLLKQETSKIEWFYPALEPYINYIPINERLTDIFTQLEWIKTHDKQAKQISLNAQNFIKNNLMPDDIDAHMVITLNEYSNLQKKQIIIPTLTPAEDVISMPALLKSLAIKISNYIKS